MTNIENLQGTGVAPIINELAHRITLLEDRLNDLEGAVTKSRITSLEERLIEANKCCSSEDSDACYSCPYFPKECSMSAILADIAVVIREYRRRK
jgi:hypothetical protein